MEVVGEALLSTALGLLFDKLCSSDLIKFARQEDVHTELKKWEKELLSIKQELNNAEDKQITEEDVKSWLFDLRVLAYDMEDVLDEFAYELMRRKLMGAEAEEASTSKKRKFNPTCWVSFIPTHVVPNVKMGFKIKEITSRLQDISARKVGLGLEKQITGAAATSAWKRPLPTTPIAYEPGVYGRDEDKQAVLDLLRKVEPNGNNVGIISIVGMGGLGKTTLARLVYNDEMAKHFDLKAWVCVSDVFDGENITKAIFNSVASSDAGGSLDFQEVQNKLADALTGKKFLLILDDVWNEDCGNWDSLRAPFSVGAKGSKVVVTTRNKGVAMMMGAEKNIYDLKTLSEDACWSVFKKHAFEHRNIDDHPNLVSIGRKIVGKCDGLPLAATTLGGLLRSKGTEDEWEKILNSKIWGWSGTEHKILPALRLSYHHLPSHLKRCFAYCAMFPKDYEFDSKDLVLLWMAEGLIQQPKDDRQTVEDLGDNYFCELLSRSFFQSSSNHESCFVIHDLIHDLAQVVSGEICFCLEDTLESNRQFTITKETRHTSFVRGEFDLFKRFEAFQKVKHLRTFVALPICPDQYSKCSVSRLVYDHLVPKFRHLRVLCLSGYLIFELPDSLGELKHLRYLNLSFTKIRSLPDSVCNLYNLQTLILFNCGLLMRLPSNIGSLINLRHLNVDGSPLQGMPQQIGKLKNVQTLSDFIVGKGAFLGIKELKHLSHVRGKIRISQLENVVDFQDARDASLKTKLNVEELCMIWSEQFDDSRNEDTEMEVLLSLQPHTSLKKLKIVDYGGRQFPNWICDPSYSKLVKLSLVGCIRCTSLPSVGQLPFLKKLVIRKMDGVRTVGLEFEGQRGKPFQRLESLCFEDMKEWEEWSWSIESFSRLLQLEIKDCPRLSKKLPTHLTSLVKLKINNCPEKMVPLPTHLPSLKELKIYLAPSDYGFGYSIPVKEVGRSAIDVTSRIYFQIDEMSRLFRLEQKFLQSLPRLQLLEIENSGVLECLWENGLGLGNLVGLRVLDCNQLVSLGGEEGHGLPCNIRYLEISKCDNLEKLPHGLHSYASLTELKLVDCAKLELFPDKGFPLILRRLTISNCQSLSSLPDNTMMISSSSNVCVLEYLHILRCPSLICFPKGQLPTTLKRLYISQCENLELQPHQLQSLTSLTSLLITNWENIKTPLSEWGLARLTSLKTLTISNYHHHHHHPLLLPSTLAELYISSFQNLESLAFLSLQRLTSLEMLRISRCPKLQSFLPREGLSDTLSQLIITECPLLFQRYSKEKGEDWPKIAHIPYVEIDFKFDL